MGKKTFAHFSLNIPHIVHFNCIAIEPKLPDDKILSGAWKHDGLERDGKLLYFEDFRRLSDMIFFFKT